MTVPWMGPFGIRSRGRKPRGGDPPDRALFRLGVAAAVGTVNARRPLRGLLTVGPSWLAAWITNELAPQLVVGATAAAGALTAAGGARTARGRLGLAAVLAADAYAIPAILRSRRTVVELDGATGELDAGDVDTGRYPRSHVALPLLAWRRRDVRVERGVAYRGNRKLDVYLPAAPSANGRRPAIVHVHGGAWLFGSRHEQGVPLLGHLAAHGWVGFNVDYRLSPRATWPDHIVDVKRAIAWVREHAEDYGVEESFVAITGGSAGGHLTALAALTANDPAFQPGFEEADTSVAAAVPFYGVYDFLDPDRIHLPSLARIVERLVFKTRRDEDPEPFRLASPAHRVHADAPPFLVIHGERDSLVPIEEARRFVARLRAVSEQPVLYAEMQGAQHAFDVVPSWRTIPVIEAIERFLAGVRTGCRASGTSGCGR